MKRQAIAALALGLALLLTAAGGVSAQEPTVPWWVIAGGGGPASGGDGTLNDTVGQAFIGGSTGEGVALDAGYWQQLYGPAAVTGLQLSITTEPRLKLDWTAVSHDASGHTIAGVTYNVYRALDAPYFTPGGTPYSPVPLPGLTFTDPDAAVLTDPAHSTYYVVEAVYNGLLSAPSNRVGAFVFSLVKGQ
jgi:hypothetical protein